MTASVSAEAGAFALRAIAFNSQASFRATSFVNFR